MPRKSKYKEGKKFDGDKLRYNLISPIAIRELARILTYGAHKYEDRNWEKGIKWDRCIDACIRHIEAWRGGETFDPDTGFNHLAHALCNLHFLLHFAVTHPELDDRPNYSLNGFSTEYVGPKEYSGLKKERDDV